MDNCPSVPCGLDGPSQLGSTVALPGLDIGQCGGQYLVTFGMIQRRMLSFSF